MVDKRQPTAPAPHVVGARNAPRALHPLTFGELLMRARVAAGLTQEELAERASVSVRTLNYLEHGKTRPQQETVRLLADALGLAPEERSAFARAARPRADAPPALAPLVATPTNIPALLTALVGRGETVAQVAALLRDPDVRLLTITGPGGIGKTRLAIAAASELLADYPDGVYFVSLAALRDAALVVPTVAETLGVRERGGTARLDALRFTLAPKRLLLVLDNCEHLPGATPEIAQLLAACPKLAILATSRGALRAYGERAFPLGPLAVSAAVTLFHQRARVAAPDFTPADDGMVAEICVRLDGLPLAIELAAARMRALSAREMHARLDNRLALLSRGPRDQPARHQAMRGAIAWSTELLTAEERLLFRRLAVFVGGWTVAEAEAVCAADDLPVGAVLDATEALLDQSLTRAGAGRNGARRLDMLETIREYALDELTASGERATVERQHAACFLALAEEAEQHLTGVDQHAWFARLESAHENLRAALAWARDTGEGETGLRLAASLGLFWYVRGHYTEGRAWLEALLAHVGEEASAAVRAKALHAAGLLAEAQAEYQQAIARHETSLALAREVGATRAMASALNGIGRVALARGDYAPARAAFEESLTLWRTLGDPGGLGALLNNLGKVAQLQGDYARAITLFEESNALRRASGDLINYALGLLNIGQVCEARGEYHRAQAALEESLQLQEEHGNRQGAAFALNSLAIVAQEQGDDRRARERFEQSLAINRDLGDLSTVAITLTNLAYVALRAGDHRRATACSTEALRLQRQIDDQHQIPRTLRCQGDIARAHGDAASARAWYAEAFALDRTANNQVNIAKDLERCALLAADGACWERAARFFGTATALRDRSGRPPQRTESALLAASITAARTALGEDMFMHTSNAGARLSVNDAIAEAAGEAP